MLAKDLTLFSVYRLNQPLWKIRHCINYFRLFYNWRIKSGKNVSENCAVLGLFSLNFSGEGAADKIFDSQLLVLRTIKSHRNSYCIK